MEQYLAVARAALDRVLTAREERPAAELWRWESVPGPADRDDPWATEHARKKAREWAETHARLLEEGPLPKDAGKKRRKQREKDLRRRPDHHDRMIGLRTAAEDLASRHPRLHFDIARPHGAWAATDPTTKTDITGQPDLTLGFARFRVSEPGTYRVRMRVASSGQPLGWRFGPPVLVVQDWPRVVPCYESPVAAGTDEPEIHAFTVDLEPGEFGLRINHKPYPDEADLGKRDPRPRILVDWIEIEGPVFPFRGWPSPAQRRFVGEVPADPGADWARAKIRGFARTAWRAPVADRDLDRLVALYEANRGEGVAPVAALGETFAAVLCAPRFLYLVEPAPGDGDPRPLTGHEVASRLSYFLWRSMPDGELLARAEADGLRTADGVAAAARRMLADPRSRNFVADFTDQWLDLRHLAEAFSADASIYPDWDEELRASMIAESRAFVAELFATDASLLECLDSDFTMLDRRLAHHYGIPGVYGDHVRRVALRDGDHRGGVLTHASVLTLTSNGTRTSPVHRGVFILERILGTPPPPPPPNAGEIANKVPGTDEVTVRERLALHRQVEECAGCHRKIDPLGLALEQFNGIGRWRTHEFSGSYVDPDNLGSPIDASAQMPDGHAFDGVEELKRTLLDRERDRFLTCIAEKMLTFALGRRLTLGDRELVGSIAARLAEEDARPSVLIDAIVRSEAFRSK